MATAGPTMSLRSSLSTQTSFERPWLGSRPASRSASSSTRASPPGMARHRVPSNTRNSLSTTGRGSSPCAPTHGATEGGMAAEAAKSQGAAAMRAASSAWARAGSPAGAVAWDMPSSAGRTSQCDRSRCTTSRARGSPSHSVGTLGSWSRSPSRRWASGSRKAASAGASITPEPGSLTTRTAPARAESSRPGTPSRLPGDSSSGSIIRPSSRRSSTSTRCRPRSVLRNTAPPRTVRSPPSTSAQDSSRDRNMCSNHCGCAGPGVSRAIPGLARPVGARRCSESCHMSKNGRSWCTCTGRNASGTTRASSRRFSRA